MGKHRILVKESGISDFFKAFFQAKAEDRDDKFLSAVERENKELAKSLETWNKHLEKSLQDLYKSNLYQGLDTREVEALLKKYNIPIPE